jgi:nucleotide-binding universal stress UspA family protein
MLNVKTLLVPTDLSANAWRAVECGVEIARSTSATLHLLHVVDASLFGPPYIPQGGFVYPMDQAEVFKRLDEIKERFPDVRIETAAVIGNPPDEIVSYADSNDIELICMSTHGRRGFTRHILGSTTEAVVRRAHCPVLSVHGQAEVRAEAGEEAASAAQK